MFTEAEIRRMEREDEETARSLGLSYGDVAAAICILDHERNWHPDFEPVDAVSRIEVVAIPQGKFLTLNGDAVAYCRDVRSTGERYLVEMFGEAVEVGRVEVRSLPVLIDAPEQPILVRAVPDTMGAAIGVVPPVPIVEYERVEHDNTQTARELARVEEHLAKMRGESVVVQLEPMRDRIKRVARLVGAWNR